MPGWLVLGSKGALGAELCRALTARKSLAGGFDLPGLDITMTKEVEAVIERLRPDVVMNAAAYTDVDGCETHIELSRRVNAEAPPAVARAAARHGARFIHVSTDFVFDGTLRRPYTEEDATNPISEYGRGKLAGERGVLDVGGDVIVIRTAWLYGRAGASFVEKMARLAAERGELRIVTDQTGSPTFAADLAGAAIALAGSGASGLFHFVNAGEATRYELVAEIVRVLDLDCRLAEAATSDFPSPAARPAWSVLSTEKYTRTTGRTPRPWREALAERLSSLARP